MNSILYATFTLFCLQSIFGCKSIIIIIIFYQYFWFRAVWMTFYWQLEVSNKSLLINIWYMYTIKLLAYQYLFIFVCWNISQPHKAVLLQSLGSNADFKNRKTKCSCSENLFPVMKAIKYCTRALYSATICGLENVEWVHVAHFSSEPLLKCSLSGEGDLEPNVF